MNLEKNLKSRKTEKRAGKGRGLSLNEYLPPPVAMLAFHPPLLVCYGDCERGDGVLL